MTINNKWKFSIQVCGGSKTTYTSKGYNAGEVKDAAQPRAEVSDACRVISPEEGDNPQWQVGPTMPRGRLMGDNVILPGKLIVNQGSIRNTPC